VTNIIDFPEPQEADDFDEIQNCDDYIIIGVTGDEAMFVYTAGIDGFADVLPILAAIRDGIVEEISNANP